MVSIKSEREIKLMREAGKILAQVHEELGKAIEPGMSTLDIDRLGERLTEALDAFHRSKTTTAIRLLSVYR